MLHVLTLPCFRTHIGAQNLVTCQNDCVKMIGVKDVGLGLLN